MASIAAVPTQLALSRAWLLAHEARERLEDQWHTPILRRGADMRPLPRTDMHHSWQVAVFALSCLLEEVARPYRKARP